MPAWLLRADAVKLDQDDSIGTAQNGVLEFWQAGAARPS
jgi:LPS-assembly protein